MLSECLNDAANNVWFLAPSVEQTLRDMFVAAPLRAAHLSGDVLFRQPKPERRLPLLEKDFF